jgi:hypothetical protein
MTNENPQNKAGQQNQPQVKKQDDQQQRQAQQGQTQQDGKPASEAGKPDASDTQASSGASKT